MAMSQRTPSHCAGDPHQLADHRFLRGRVGVVELQGVGPAGKIRIAAVGEEQIARFAFDPACSSAAHGPGRVPLPGMKYSGCSSIQG